jgi:hypothetical protein
MKRVIVILVASVFAGLATSGVAAHASVDHGVSPAPNFLYHG